jgi:uncharacterized alpha-E superfamily protein
MSCIEAARSNGRAVRTALTVDMWEAVNETWSEARHTSEATFTPDNLPVFLDWMKSRTVLFNGAYADTMLRDEAWRFVRLGTMLERADNTARVLDVHHLALADAEEGGAVAYVQWQAILRSVSALRAYHWVYHARLEPRRIAELLMLRPELPRSMIACYARIEETPDGLAAAHGGKRCAGIALGQGIDRVKGRAGCRDGNNPRHVKPPRSPIGRRGFGQIRRIGGNQSDAFGA